MHPTVIATTTFVHCVTNSFPSQSHNRHTVDKHSKQLVHRINLRSNGSEVRPYVRMVADLVEETDCRGQQQLSQKRQKWGQSCSDISPGLKQQHAGSSLWQQVYCVMSLRK
jgi:hypothetical protein